MPARPRAIVIGPDKLSGFFRQLCPEWDFTASPQSINALWAGLHDGTIDNNAQVIIVPDRFFENGEKSEEERRASNEEFAYFASTMAPFCLFLVCRYADENYHARFKTYIETYAESNGFTAPRMFYIDSVRPKESIEAAVATYVDQGLNPAVAAILTGKDPQEAASESEAVQEVGPASATSDAYFEDVESDHLGKVIAVTSSKGGSGKSTVAISLATYLSHSSLKSVEEGLEERPLKVVVLDLDVRDGQVGFFIGSISPSVLKMRSEGISDQTLASTVIYSPRLKVDVLLAPKRPRLSDDTPPEFYLQLIQFLKRHYDYIILDTSVNYLDQLLEKVAYPVADAIIGVTDMSKPSVMSISRWIQEVTSPKEQGGMGIPKEKVGIVINKTIKNVNMSGEMLVRAAQGTQILTAIPNNAKLITHAANIQAMDFILKHDDIRSAFSRLAHAVTGNHYRLSSNLF